MHQSRQGACQKLAGEGASRELDESVHPGQGEAATGGEGGFLQARRRSHIEVTAPAVLHQPT